MINNTSNLSILIGIAFFAFGLGWVLFIYHLIRKKLLEDASIDKLIELGKWFMVSVAMVLGAAIITDSFKEREQDMKEMDVFDKYVKTITEVEGIEQRWLLCQYFATVSPSGQLKKSWSDYQDTLKADYYKYKSEKVTIAVLETKDSLNEKEQIKLVNLKESTALMEKSLVTPIVTSPTIDKRIDIDIFYLEGNPTLKDKAEKIEDEIDATKYNVRVRMLKIETNKRAGYGITDNQMRVDTDYENSIATNLNDSFGLQFKIVRTGKNPTPFYFSIFIVR